jgi:hypothetical protein
VHTVKRDLLVMILDDIKYLVQTEAFAIPIDLHPEGRIPCEMPYIEVTRATQTTTTFIILMYFLKFNTNTDRIKIFHQLNSN